MEILPNTPGFDEEEIDVIVPRFQRKVKERFWDIYWMNFAYIMIQLELKNAPKWAKSTLFPLEKQLKGYSKYGYQSDKAWNVEMDKVIYRCNGPDTAFMRQTDKNTEQIQRLVKQNWEENNGDRTQIYEELID